MLVPVKEKHELHTFGSLLIFDAFVYSYQRQTEHSVLYEVAGKREVRDCCCSSLVPKRARLGFFSDTAGSEIPRTQLVSDLPLSCCHAFSIIILLSCFFLFDRAMIEK